MDWGDSLYGVDLFIEAWPVINFAIDAIVEPFLWAVQQFQGVGEVVAVVRETVFFCLKYRPGAFKFNFTLGLFECQGALVVIIVFDVVYPHVVYYPVLNNGHFQVFGDFIEFRRTWDYKFTGTFVNRNETCHGEVIEGACFLHFNTVHIQLTEIHWIAVYSWCRGCPYVLLCYFRKHVYDACIVPSFDFCASAYDWTFSFSRFNNSRRIWFPGILMRQGYGLIQTVCTSF